MTPHTELGPRISRRQPVSQFAAVAPRNPAGRREPIARRALAIVEPPELSVVKKYSHHTVRIVETVPRPSFCKSPRHGHIILAA